MNVILRCFSNESTIFILVKEGAKIVLIVVLGFCASLAFVTLVIVYKGEEVIAQKGSADHQGTRHQEAARSEMPEHGPG